MTCFIRALKFTATSQDKEHQDSLMTFRMWGHSLSLMKFSSVYCWRIQLLCDTFSFNKENCFENKKLMCLLCFHYSDGHDTSTLSHTYFMFWLTSPTWCFRFKTFLVEKQWRQIYNWRMFASKIWKIHLSEKHNRSSSYPTSRWLF